jgi:type I restriction enzyme S subunit
MKNHKLGQHILQIRGISFKPEDVIDLPREGYVPIIKSNNITEDGFFKEDLIFINSKFVRPEQFIKNGDIVLTASSGSKKTIGKNIQFDNNYNGTFGAFCKLIRAQKTIWPKYLYHFFRTRFFRNSIEKTVQGANISNLKNEHIDDLEIFLPSFDDQIRIATVLTRAEKLVAKRKESIKMLDELVKSTFLEMFGDPVRNEMGWKREFLSNVVAEKIGYGIVQPGNPVDDGVPVIRVGDFDGMKINNSNIQKVKWEISEKHKNSILKGDEILLACVGATIGKVALVSTLHKGYNIVRATARIRAGSKINKYYLAHFLISDYSQKYYFKVTRTVGQPTLNINQIENLTILCPPLQFQKQFAAIVEKIDSLKTKYTKSLTELENLYGSLSQRAFKGELDLSGVVV